jgi:3',5'-cyclic AMP phosphodiesterase CpdA
MKFIHVTDPHFVTPGETLFGLDLRDRLEKCIASINASHADADCCVWTGDIVHWGDEASYRHFREVIEALAMPSHFVMGNHDARAAMRAVFPETPVDENGFVQYVLDKPGGRFIILDTIKPGTHAGELCADRLAWLAARLAESRDRDVYLFMHHPPFDVGIAGMDRIRLEGGDAFADVVAGHPRIRHLFFGHLHRPVHGSWRGIPFSTLRAVSHAFRLDFGPAPRLVKTHENPGYSVVLLKGDTVVVHDHSYLEEGPDFEYVDPPKNG